MLFDPKWNPIEIKIEPWQKVLLDAANLLESAGWCQNMMGDSFGRHCAIGAIHAVKCDDLHSMANAACALSKHIQTGFSRSKYIDIPDWNDYRGRTKEQVIATMRKVAKT